MRAKEMNAFYENASPEIKNFYQALKAYIPTQFLTTIMSVPYPKQSKEILFIIKKKPVNRLFKV